MSNFKGFRDGFIAGCTHMDVYSPSLISQLYKQALAGCAMDDTSVQDESKKMEMLLKQKMLEDNHHGRGPGTPLPDPHKLIDEEIAIDPDPDVSDAVKRMGYLRKDYLRE